MNRAVIRSATAIAATGLALSLTACGSGTRSTAPQPAPPTRAAVMPAGCGRDGAVVLAVAGHANAPTPVITARMQSAIDVAITSHAAIGLVSIDGKPTLVDAGVFSSDAGNTDAVSGDEATFRSSLEAAVEGVRSDSSHADDLQALRLSADAAHAACSHGGTIFLEDSGLSDTGALNFAATDLLQAEPAELVAFLRQHNALPSLSGLTVVVDVGNTAPPQQPLTISARRNLAGIWVAVATAAGARQVVLDSSPISGDAPSHVPPVSTVRIPANPVYRVKHTGKTSFALPNSGPVGFLPDVATFRDPRAAAAALDRLATQLRAIPGGVHVTLTGTTSSAGGSSAAAEAGRVRLSLARAAAVRAFLVTRHIPAADISVRGVGTQFPQFETDTDGSGNLLPGPAEHNRSVLVSVVAG